MAVGECGGKVGLEELGDGLGIGVADPLGRDGEETGVARGVAVGLGEEVAAPVGGNLSWRQAPRSKNASSMPSQSLGLAGIGEELKGVMV